MPSANDLHSPEHKDSQTMSHSKKTGVTASKKGQSASSERLRNLEEEAAFLDREIAESKQGIDQSPVGYRPDEPEKELGARLQDARRAARLTQGELSERTKLADPAGKGIARTVISSYESNVNRPSPRELRLLCEVLRVTPNELIYGDDDPLSGLSEHMRFSGWGRSEAEFLAYLTYAFTRLHKHPRMGLMQVMLSVLRGWEKDFDERAHREAYDVFLQKADELRLTLASRKKRE